MGSWSTIEILANCSLVFFFLEKKRGKTKKLAASTKLLVSDKVTNKFPFIPWVHREQISTKFEVNLP